jgi:hypothetical protein
MEGVKGLEIHRCVWVFVKGDVKGEIECLKVCVFGCVIVVCVGVCVVCGCVDVCGCVCVACVWRVCVCAWVCVV